MNERIRSKEVRLIDDKGTNHGIVPTSKALQMAEEADLDLVLISPNQAPPVAKILDYGKYKYELAKKYIVYRYTRALVRKANTTDQSIKELMFMTTK